MLPDTDFSTSVLFFDDNAADRKFFAEGLKQYSGLSDIRSPRWRIGAGPVSVSANRLCPPRTELPGSIGLRGLGQLDPQR